MKNVLLVSAYHFGFPVAQLANPLSGVAKLAEGIEQRNSEPIYLLRRERKSAREE